MGWHNLVTFEKPLRYAKGLSCLWDEQQAIQWCLLVETTLKLKESI